MEVVMFIGGVIIGATFAIAFVRFTVGGGDEG